MMNKTNELKVEAIKLVESVRPVITDQEFIDYTHKATRVRYDEEGGVDLSAAVFGKDSEGIRSRITERHEMFSVIGDNSIPLGMRIFYVNNHLGSDYSWERFKEEMKS